MYECHDAYWIKQSIDIGRDLCAQEISAARALKWYL